MESERPDKREACVWLVAHGSRLRFGSSSGTLVEEIGPGKFRTNLLRPETKKQRNDNDANTSKLGREVREYEDQKLPIRVRNER